MRALTFALSALVLFSAAEAFAKPKKGGAAAKKPPVSAPAESRPAAIPESAPPAAADTGTGPSVRGPTRIDFDDRLIQGQSNKSGAVYLYDRKELKIRSMIKKRENFRDEIVGSLYDT